MSGFLEAWRSDFRTMKPYVIWAVLTLVIGFAGPFGTYVSLSLPKRLLLWALLVFFSILIGFSVRAFVEGTLKLRRFFDGTLLTAGLNCVILPPILTLVIRLVDTRVEPPSHDEFAIFVFLVSLSAGTYRKAAAWQEKRHLAAAKVPDMRHETGPEPILGADHQPVARIIQRLPAAMQGDLISISVRDHYVDVVTDKGTASLLMRLSDAMAETDPCDGAQVHRSHWVSWDAVEGLEKTQDRFVLLMRQGGAVPVSKPYRRLVEARGIGMARAEVPPQRIASAPDDISDESAGSSHQSPPV